MAKKAYMKPAMRVVRIQQQHIICVSKNQYGVNTKLQSDEVVSSAWSRDTSGWDDDEE